eukprot:15169764-Heterocapsa_arctica.AAC.1
MVGELASPRCLPAPLRSSLPYSYMVAKRCEPWLDKKEDKNDHEGKEVDLEARRDQVRPEPRHDPHREQGGQAR